MRSIGFPVAFVVLQRLQSPRALRQHFAVGNGFVAELPAAVVVPVALTIGHRVALAAAVAAVLVLLFAVSAVVAAGRLHKAPHFAPSVYAAASLVAHLAAAARLAVQPLAAVAQLVKLLSAPVAVFEVLACPRPAPAAEILAAVAVLLVLLRMSSAAVADVGVLRFEFADAVVAFAFLLPGFLALAVVFVVLRLVFRVHGAALVAPVACLPALAVVFELPPRDCSAPVAAVAVWLLVFPAALAALAEL